MLEIEAEIFGYIQQRLGFAMVVIGKLAGFEFNCSILRQESNLGHNLIVRSIATRLETRYAIEEPMNTAAGVANNWGPAVLIVFGYTLAAFFQNKRVDDLRTWLEAKFRLMNEKIDKLDSRVLGLLR